MRPQAGQTVIGVLATLALVLAAAAAAFMALIVAYFCVATCTREPAAASLAWAAVAATVAGALCVPFTRTRRAGWVLLALPFACCVAAIAVQP